MSKITASRLYHSSFDVPIFYLADVYITGILAEKSDIKPIDYAAFRGPSTCINSLTISTHRITISKMYDLHETRVVYDRVRNRKNYFEIPAFLQIERGKSRAGNSKHQMKTKTFLFSFDFEFPALEVPCS